MFSYVKHIAKLYPDTVFKSNTLQRFSKPATDWLCVSLAAQLDGLRYDTAARSFVSTSDEGAFEAGEKAGFAKATVAMSVLLPFVAVYMVVDALSANSATIATAGLVVLVIAAVLSMSVVYDALERDAEVEVS
jgi:hypothetical protein